MTRLGIIRHGSTAWNKEGRAQGSTDIPLDEEGLLQAARLGERMQSEPWDIIITSPLGRARQTAEHIAAKIGSIPLLFEDQLREAGGGLIEGTTVAERIERWGEGWRTQDLGMESSEQVTARGTSFVENILREHPGKNILIVSHGSFIRHLLKALLPTSYAHESIKNTSVTSLLYSDRAWTCELYNCTKHLDE
ncbi:histidine phosphatase family protein [Paenibacillus selenitireducens]|uniref:Histidine phosphatase family protein n=1 Tax=Paenibacillus selenitireducens TaxID=1324314 RepID=A0A1T2XN07_9BACL|nr:histidine phosphatase family protein [Paenibacillus selenitireducens]OPA81241.1 histidine phosphatase family protein [Paenibacillus selenitireducens]